jgi:hypothetical protein
MASRRLITVPIAASAPISQRVCTTILLIDPVKALVHFPSELPDVGLEGGHVPLQDVEAGQDLPELVPGDRPLLQNAGQPNRKRLRRLVPPGPPQNLRNLQTPRRHPNPLRLLDTPQASPARLRASSDGRA